jgi:hypothetical protein
MRFEGARVAGVKLGRAGQACCDFDITVHGCSLLSSAKGRGGGPSYCCVQGRQGQVGAVGKRTGALCTRKLLGKAR